MNERLQTALDALRYDPNEKPTVRINLLFGFMTHAMVRADDEMQEACEAEIKKIRAGLPPPPPPVRTPVPPAQPPSAPHGGAEPEPAK